MPGFGRCTESSCNQTAVRLFDCAHHCMKMVCLHHLIEHDRVFEQTKNHIENHQLELKRLYSIYSSFIDENKIRTEYEQKLDEYKKLVNEVNSLIENHSNDIEQLRSAIDKLKNIIHDKQKQAGESLTIVKVEPIEENTALTTSSQKDDSLFIGFDRLQNLVIDTDYHRRKMNEASAVKETTENEPMITNDDNDDDCDNMIPSIPNRRIPGICPLWMNGAYGLSKNHHHIRLCRENHYADLSNHMRQYHGLLTPIATAIARAIHAKIPTTKCLIPADLQVADPHRSFLCPFRAECGHQSWLLAMSLKSHLIDVHRMNASMAESKVNTIRKLNKNKPMSKIRIRILEIIEKIDEESKH